MEASVFKAMVEALVERPEEADAGDALDQHHEEESSHQVVPADQHLSLVEADTNAFYGDTAFFAKLPARVRFGRTRAFGTIVPRSTTTRSVRLQFCTGTYNTRYLLLSYFDFDIFHMMYVSPRFRRPSIALPSAGTLRVLVRKAVR